MICIAIDNGSNNTVGGSYYSAHQAVGKFGGHHIKMVSFVHRKCQTRAGISGNVNKTLDCVTICPIGMSSRREKTIMSTLVFDKILTFLEGINFALHK